MVFENDTNPFTTLLLILLLVAGCGVSSIGGGPLVPDQVSVAPVAPVSASPAT